MSPGVMNPGIMPTPVTIAGMELVDLSVMLWPDGEFILQLHRWPLTTAAGRLAIALAWPGLRVHHGEILRFRRNLDRSVLA